MLNVKKNEQYKRIVKFSFSLIIVLLEMAVYWYVWSGYYNKIIEFPFWRRGNWLMVALYAVLLLFFLKTYGGFKIGYLKRGNLIGSQILSLFFVNIITYVQISLLDKKFHDARAILSMTVIQVLAVIVWAYIFQWLYQKIFPPKRLLLVYGERPVFHLMEKINSREDKYYLAGAVHIQRGVRKIMETAGEYDAVIIGDVPAHERNLLMKMFFYLSVRTYTVPKISDILIRTSSDLDIFDSPLLLSRNEGLQIEQVIVKRLMDIIFSSIGLLITSPFFLIIYICIKMTDGGPVFYKQKRLTKDGAIFEIYKFRTMIQNAEQHTGACLALAEDDRILPVGKLLRRARLDELPQLWNILKGEMSLVGPRPERPELAQEIEEDIPEFAYRLRVKAGLTGFAQVYGKYNTTSYDKLKLDLAYIMKYSVWLDLRLMLMTPKVMLIKESTEGVKETQFKSNEQALTKDMRAQEEKLWKVGK